ncbi:MAG: hypothetical protein HGN29_08315 [Asgard group archaeon]|nr:hypothetical protein [Asgard group archaeon]
MYKNRKRKFTTTICLVFLLVAVILLEFSNNSTIGTIAENESDLKIKLQYWTEGIIISDANISALSSSGTGSNSDPYIIDNLFIDTTDSLAVEFEGVSTSTHYVLRDSYLKGSTYGVYISDSIFGKASIINCTIEGALSVGGPNARYLLVHNNTLTFNQGSSFRKGITFTENIIISKSPYSVHLGRFRNEDNIIKDNVFYGNNSEILLNNIVNSTIENNVLHNAGFDFSNNDVKETTNNTMEGNTIDGKPYGFFYNKTGEIIDGDIYGQIYLFNSVNSEIKDHTLSGSGYGIQIHKCTDIVVDSVEITGKNGIDIKESVDILIEKNVLVGYGNGINLNLVNDIDLQNNHLTGFAYGIDSFLVDELYINNNTILENEDNGIYLDDCDNIEIWFNIVTINVEVPGSEPALVFWGCENVTIFYNVFINLGNNTESPVEGNSSTNVIWYDETLDVGNHYSDWIGAGNYLIPGDVGSIDIYPFIDVDGDLLEEYEEVVVYHTNPFETDSDNDGLDDNEEINTYNTDPLSNDSDSDGMDDLWEVTNGTDPNTDDADEDLDDDGLTNIEEYNLNTLPTNNDTDADGMDDYWEATYGTDPLIDDAENDPDEDGLTNLTEYSLGTLPMNNDTDGDSFTDGVEVIEGTDPLDPNDYPKYAPIGLILGLIFGLVVPLGVAVLVVLARKGKITLPFIKKK